MALKGRLVARWWGVFHVFKKVLKSFRRVLKSKNSLKS
jgi:hypothetical protein